MVILGTLCHDYILHTSRPLGIYILAFPKTKFLQLATDADWLMIVLTRWSLARHSYSYTPLVTDCLNKPTPSVIHVQNLLCRGFAEE